MRSYRRLTCAGMNPLGKAQLHLPSNHTVLPDLSQSKKTESFKTVLTVRDWPMMIIRIALATALLHSQAIQ